MADANNGDTQGAASSSSSRNADALDGASTTTTTSGPAPKRGRRGGRAPSNPAAAHGSAQYRIFRVMEEGRWVPAANAAVKGSRVDSLVHRYGREVGFKKVNPYDDEKQIEAARKKLEELQKKSNAAEAAAAAAAGVGNVQLSENEDEEEKEEEGKEDDDTTDDERLQNISEAARHVEVNSKSNRERVSEQAQFEEYMQAVHPNSKYVKDFLSRLKGKEAGVYLVAPEEKHLLSYMYHCRDTDDSRTEGVVGRSNKGSNIRKKLNFISGTLIEFDHAKLHRTKKMMELITLWEGEDDVARALSFTGDSYAQGMEGSMELKNKRQE